MVKPDVLSGYADDLVNIYRQLEDSIIEDMTRRMYKMKVTQSSVWQAERLQEMGGVSDDIFARLAETTQQSQEAVRTAYMDAGTRIMQYARSYMPMAMSPAMEALLVNGMARANGALWNLTQTTASGMANEFYKLSGRAQLQVSSGAMDYATAISRAVKQLAHQGVNIVHYASGRRDQIDVAVRRNVLTSVNQTVGEMQLQLADDMGTDLVETTAHASAREEHQPWQGRVFSVSGKNRNYPDFYRSTEYGTATGLCGINCRHNFYPFMEGRSTRAYSNDTLESYKSKTVNYNDEDMPLYDATQVQRRLEREIRATKRELIAYDALLGTAQADDVAQYKRDYQQASKTLKAQREALDSFLKQTGLRMQSDRIQVPQFSHSQSSRASWAARPRKVS